MSRRPEILFPLFATVQNLPGVGPKSAKLLEKIGITRVRDLLFTLPQSGVQRKKLSSIADAVLPAVVTVEVEVLRHQPASGRGRPHRVFVEDAARSFQLVFFHAHGDWLNRMFPVGARRVVSGKVELFDNLAQMTHPDHITRPEDADQIPEFEVAYPLTAGITQKQMHKAAAGALALHSDLPEWIEPSVFKQQSWPDWSNALTAAHHPDRIEAISPLDPARQRLAYDELLAHQLTLALARAGARRKPGRANIGTGALNDAVLKALPFQPTGAQTRAGAEIAADLSAPHRMNRLLQGDVGSGKTLVALLAMLHVVEAGGQSALMAPTEILARQHLEGLKEFTQHIDVEIEILTGRDKGAARQAKLQRLQSGEIDILIGTHALFQGDVNFADLRFAVIDEQHRFGVAQRMELGAKGAGVDVLVMTATPIPRSLALTHYGDMDLSVLDEKPPGRKPVETVLVSQDRLEEVIGRLSKALAQGRQAYWVCPLVEESEVSDLSAAQSRFTQLRAVLGEGKVGLVHGQMPPAEKDTAMAQFVAGETQLLVATTVIEVGVNVPNASIMVIERAENFGLAQLHQLRGRVGRGAAASSCLLMYQAPLGEAAKARLSIMRETEDGFRISEEDMRIRGAGDVIGTAQSGLPRFQIADLESQSALMEIARDDARLLLAQDPGLETPRGQAARVLLYLMEQDRAIRLLNVG